MTIGLRRYTVHLVDHSSEWNKSFIVEKSRLLNLLSDTVKDLQHIGSTSIQTIQAKPIIDMLMVVDSIEDVKDLQEKLESLNYELRENGCTNDKKFFVLGAEDNRTHYLHITTLGSKTHKDTIFFRDYLNSHTEVAKLYESIKIQLSKTTKNDRKKYTDSKAQFIEAVLSLKKEQSGTNYAFIDSKNVHLSIRAQGWNIDWGRFRIYLQEHYNVSKAFLFIGYIKENKSLYSSLEKSGFTLVFKPTLTYRNNKTKGNTDAEMLLWAMHHLNDFSRAIIVTGDGDFHCLIKYLLERDKLAVTLVPNMYKYSALLKKFSKKNIAFMNNLKSKISHNMKRTPTRQNS